MPKKNNGKVNFKELLNQKRSEINKGNWESINKIPLNLLANMVFTVKEFEIQQIETEYGLSDIYVFDKDGVEYHLLTKSKVFKSIWLDNIEVGMKVTISKDDKGWYIE